MQIACLDQDQYGTILAALSNLTEKNRRNPRPLWRMVFLKTYNGDGLVWKCSCPGSTRPSKGAHGESPDGSDLPRPTRQYRAQDRLLAGGARRALLRLQGCGRADYPCIAQGRPSAA